MKLDIASLGIGAATGAVIVTAAVAIFAMQPGKVVLDGELAKSAVAANNGTHFYLSGLITEMSEDMIFLIRLLEDRISMTIPGL
jgi:hypothetical protein